MKSRAEAIRHALDEYNKYAVQLNPPRDQISWSTIVNAVFLSELDILKDTRQDIRKLKWANIEHRQASQLYFSIKRAKEEIARLNVEARRLLTGMFDEHCEFRRAIASTVASDPPLSFELARIWSFRDKLNTKVAERLLSTSKLTGFTGDLTVGVRKGREVLAGAPDILPAWASKIRVIAADSVDLQSDAAFPDLDNVEGNDDNNDEEESEDVAGMVSFLTSFDGDSVEAGD